MTTLAIRFQLSKQGRRHSTPVAIGFQIGSATRADQQHARKTPTFGIGEQRLLARFGFRLAGGAPGLAPATSVPPREGTPPAAAARPRVSSAPATASTSTAKPVERRLLP